ncbi:hypothetical protein K0M31_014023 [Melipona bicolor]|uniref:Uncharacterized protein n=1 Tax=Melipona bicolor TaxID=60889 RepID=A0AA40G7Q5_9HYME|nr:hypothetical protein K0M31_014023 [Melipona bicolor]
MERASETKRDETRREAEKEKDRKDREVGERLDAPQEDEEAAAEVEEEEEEESAAAAATAAAGGQTDQGGQRGQGNLDSARGTRRVPPIATKSLCPLLAGKSSIQTVYHCVSG